MDQVTKVDNSTYSTIVQTAITYSVDDDKTQLDTLQQQLDTLNQKITDVNAAMQNIRTRLSAASQVGVSDATLVVQDKNNQPQG